MKQSGQHDDGLIALDFREQTTSGSIDSKWIHHENVSQTFQDEMMMGLTDVLADKDV